MPKPTAAQIQNITDRMAQQYQMLLDLQAIISPMTAPGTHGRYTDQILATGNPNFISYTLDAGQLLDNGFTAQSVIRYNNYWTVLTLAIQAHLNAEKQHHLLNGFLQDNALQLHEHYNTIHHEATGEYLWARNTFSGNPKLLATITIQGVTSVLLEDLASLGPANPYTEAPADPGIYGPAPLTLTVNPNGGITQNETTLVLALRKHDYTTVDLPVSIPTGTPGGTIIPLGSTKYYELQHVGINAGGTTGDSYTLNSTVERNISL